MAARLVITQPDHFEPDDPITRSDFAEYITRALGVYHTGTTTDSAFADIDAGQLQARGINAAVDYGIISGYPDGRFAPDRTITREEVMTMFAKAMEMTRLEEIPGNHLSAYADQNTISQWARPFINKSVGSGIFKGRTEETIDPVGTFTYAEAATALRNLLIEAELINRSASVE